VNSRCLISSLKSSWALGRCFKHRDVADDACTPSQAHVCRSLQNTDDWPIVSVGRSGQMIRDTISTRCADAFLLYLDKVYRQCIPVWLAFTQYPQSNKHSLTCLLHTTSLSRSAISTPRLLCIRPSTVVLVRRVGPPTVGQPHQDCGPPFGSFRPWKLEGLRHNLDALWRHHQRCVARLGPGLWSALGYRMRVCVGRRRMGSAFRGDG